MSMRLAQGSKSVVLSGSGELSKSGCKYYLVAVIGSFKI